MIRPPSRRGRPLVVVGAVALVFSAGAFAYVCHADPAGTRVLAVAGAVDGYQLRGARVTVAAWIKGCERRISWLPLVGRGSQSGCTAKPPHPGPPPRTASDGRFRVELV